MELQHNTWTKVAPGIHWRDVAPALLREGPCRGLQRKTVLTSTAGSMEEERGLWWDRAELVGGPLSLWDGSPRGPGVTALPKKRTSCAARTGHPHLWQPEAHGR